MIIGGFHTLSLCDFPNTPAAVLFLQGCNWRCVYCHNKKLIPCSKKEGPITYKEVISFLKSRVKMIKGVVFTGGEPTLHEDLEEHIKEIKDLGFLIKLDTNGSNPSMLKKLIDSELLDYIAMDIKAPLEKYKSIIHVPFSKETIKESIELISKSKIEHQFRTTWSKALLTKEDIDMIKEFLPKSSPYIVQECKM